MTKKKNVTEDNYIDIQPYTKKPTQKTHTNVKFNTDSSKFEILE